MCIIMLFNDQKEWRVSEILAVTKIPDKDLKRTLQSLSTGKQKILWRQDGTSGEIGVENLNSFGICLVILKDLQVITQASS